MFTIHRITAPRETLSYRPSSVMDCRHYFIRDWSNHRISLFDETGDGQEIFIVIANDRGHIRFHAKRG